MRPLPLLPSVPSDDPIAYLERELKWDHEWTGQAKELYARRLPPLGTVRTLPFLFGVSPTLIHHMLSSPQHYYRTFHIPRHNRSARRIHAPRVALKVIQRWIHDHILPKMTVHEAATAFAPSGGIFVNATPHVGAANLLKMDVLEFFPSVRPTDVYEAFDTLGFNNPVTQQLTGLVTYCNGLPQGAPTSPLLANAVMYSVDSALNRLAAEWHGHYTRYADDLTFSSNQHRFNLDDVARVAEVLHKVGFKANEEKTRIIGGGFRHVVAGVSMSTSTMAPRAKRRAWRALFHQASLAPKAYTSRYDEMNGIAGFVGQYAPTLSARYREIAALVGQNREQGGD